jgi:hypothetical protein
MARIKNTIFFRESLMEKVKRKNTDFNPRRYWRIFLPLTLVLLFCLRFPIRITIPDLYDDILLYGGISLVSFLVALRIYRRSKWVYRRLLAVILLCSILVGWQVIDLAYLRLPTTGHALFADETTLLEDYRGVAYYEGRFNNPYCYALSENFFGFRAIAIRLEYQPPHPSCA